MLSILIPIYNFDVRAFVNDLSALAAALGIPAEIICLDDASDEPFYRTNHELAALPNVRYERSSKNLGRSAVRNRLVQMATHDNLLFLDCDGKCPDSHYLSRYVERMAQPYDVVYGGRIYNDEAPDDHDFYFHWYCGSNREAILIENRFKDPYKTFMTNNFLVKRAVYEAVKMDESLTGYGHEDTLFAIELKRAGYTIAHIDNPIEHIGLEPFEVFMRKSENGVKNLAYLIKNRKVDDSVKLVKYHSVLRIFGLMWLVSALVGLFSKRIFIQLKGPAPNLLYFDLWKLRELHRYFSLN